MPQATRNSSKKQTATKADLVRSLPPDMPAAEVVKKVEEAGMTTLTTAHVHTIRSQAKKAATKGSKSKKVAAPKKAAGKTSKPSKAKPVGKRKAIRGDKSGFILAQPSAMAATEVVKEGEKVGLTFTAKYVYSARARAQMGKKTVAKTPKVTKKPVAKKAPRKARKSEKGDFVRSMPATSTAKEVIAAAKKRGMKLSKNYVYMVRDKADKTTPVKVEPKKPVEKVSKVKAQPKRKVTTAKAPPTVVLTPEMVFVRLALDIGLQRAKDLLSAVDDKIAALVASI